MIRVAISAILRKPIAKYTMKINNVHKRIKSSFLKLKFQPASLILYLILTNYATPKAVFLHRFIYTSLIASIDYLNSLSSL